MRIPPGAGLLVAAIAYPAHAQVPASLELVRCSSASDAACLRARALVGGGQVTFGAGADGVAGLARTATRRAGTLTFPDGTRQVELLSWRPPLMAMPTFRGVADSASVSPALRDAILIGTGGSNRPVIALLMAVILTFAWLLVVYLGRRDAGPAAARERSTTTRTGAAGAAGDEGAPRTPEEITKQTARRTALGR